jgi:HAD superfamily hydrolase (TIGR01549 family)
VFSVLRSSSVSGFGSEFPFRSSFGSGERNNELRTTNEKLNVEIEHEQSTREHRSVNHPNAVLFDIDGTLVDSNDAHADAWVKAFAEAGIHVEFHNVRCAIGMGGDKLMPAVAGIEEDSLLGTRISQRRSEIFKMEYLSNLRAFRDAGALVSAVQGRGLKAVAASSAKRDELEALLRIAGALSLMGHSASADDAEKSKPEPDIVHAALKKIGIAPSNAVLIGDTPYDVEAAMRAGVRAIAFRCGGWSDASLEGAIAIYDGPWDLLAQLDESPVADPKSQIPRTQSPVPIP